MDYIRNYHEHGESSPKGFIMLHLINFSFPFSNFYLKHNFILLPTLGKKGKKMFNECKIRLFSFKRLKSREGEKGRGGDNWVRGIRCLLRKHFSIMKIRRGKDSGLSSPLISSGIGHHGAAGATQIMREELPGMSKILGSPA